MKTKDYHRSLARTMSAIKEEDDDHAPGSVSQVSGMLSVHWV